MSDDQSNVFNQEPAPTPQPDSSNLFTDQLNMIKNDDGAPKYDSVPKALEALQHSQAYIPEIKTQLDARDSEIAALKEQLSKASTIDEVVDRFTASQGQAPEGTPAPQPAPLDEQAIISLLDSHSAQQKQVQSAQTNEMEVSNALVAKFGDKAADALKAKAAELGMTTDAMKSLAQQSPTAVMQFFGAAASPSAPPTQSSVNLPIGGKKEEALQPETSLLSGATYKDQLGFLNKVREEVYKKHGVDNV